MVYLLAPGSRSMPLKFSSHIIDHIYVSLDPPWRPWRPLLPTHSPAMVHSWTLPINSWYASKATFINSLAHPEPSPIACVFLPVSSCVYRLHLATTLVPCPLSPVVHPSSQHLCS